MERVVIARGCTFAVSRPSGDIVEPRDGFYHYDTRFLSRLQVVVEGWRISYYEHFVPKPWLHVSLARLEKDGQQLVMVREREVSDSGLTERLRFYGEESEVKLRVAFEPSFHDVFEVRGFRGLRPRPRRYVAKSSNEVLYVGREGATRVLRVLASGGVAKEGELVVSLKVEPDREAVASFEFEALVEWSRKPPVLPEALDQGLPIRVYASNPVLNAALSRAVGDLEALTLRVPRGLTVVAGYPDFACIFGRDSLLTALFMLPFEPAYARGTLSALAKLQCKLADPWRDGEPGKIPHEYRLGELAVGNEVPFSPYYGSVDSTPLFIALAHEYLKWTGDAEFVKEIAPSLRAAVEWVVSKLEEGDGLLRYERRSPLGLVNQGWKDSADGVLHEDGTAPRPPVAVVEAQGYAYWALVSAEELAEIVGLDVPGVRDLAARLAREVERVFWLPGKRFYALAVDSEGRASRVVSSNPGHLLVSGLPVKCKEIAKRLAERDMLSRWGLRTLSSLEKVFDPASYHRGSVWPHDTAVVALGAARRGLTREARLFAESLLRLAAAEAWRSLSEAYLGADTVCPVPLPRANRPQAWSAASLFAALQALVNFEPDPPRASPHVPDWVGELKLLYSTPRGKVLVTVRGSRYSVRPY